jgi:hypothetical protein
MKRPFIGLTATGMATILVPVSVHARLGCCFSNAQEILPKGEHRD